MGKATIDVNHNQLKYLIQTEKEYAIYVYSNLYTQETYIQN